MAVITNKLKKQVIDSIKTDFDNSSNRYYIGLGKSEQFNTADTVPAALNHDFEERTFRNALQAIMEVSDFSFVVPRYNWSSGTTYSAYSDKQAGYPIQPYYVMNDENQVYICIQQGKDTDGNPVNSTDKPTGQTGGAVFSTNDGYAWKFLYSISAASANKFMSANFIPVKLQGSTTNASPAADVEQLAVQTAAVAGEIVGYEVLSRGDGYSATPTVTVIGDGTSATAVATISGAQVSRVEVNDNGGVYPLGSGYNNASITLSGGSPSTEAVIRPIFGPKAGLGADPTIDLRATAVMFTVKPSGAQGSDFIVGNDFRQVGLLKNPLQSVGGSAFTETTGRALRQLVLGSKTSDFTIGATITGANGAKGIIDNIENSGQTLSYHQNEDTGHLEFVISNNISGSSGGAGVSAGSSHITAPEFGTTTGEVLYIDNRAAVTRASDQTEDIKIVIQI